jgi:hypothetical protein
VPDMKPARDPKVSRLPVLELDGPGGGSDDES